MNTLTIAQSIITANPAALAVETTTAWDIHNNSFGVNSKAAKAAHKMACRVAANYSCEFDVFAVCGAKGRSQHSASEVVLLAIPRGTDLDRCARIYWKLESASNA